MSRAMFEEDIRREIEDEFDRDTFDDLTTMGELAPEDRAQQDSDAGLFRNDGFAYNNLAEDDLSFE